MTADPAADLLRRLAEGPGARLLDTLPPYDERHALALQARLRADGHDPELVSAALTQSRLRTRGRDRLGPGVDDLLLTPDGLEQATRPGVATRRAGRLARTGVRHVLDLGCGLGLDAIAFAREGLEVTAVERDPVVAAAARANLAPWPGARVLTGDALAHPVGAGDGAFLDPARRVPGVADARGRTRRVRGLEGLSPSFEQVQDVARRARATVAKLGPSFDPRDVPAGADAEWVSLDGDLLECALWWGAGPPRRRAVVGRTIRPGTATGCGGSEVAAVWEEVVEATDAPTPLEDPAGLLGHLAEVDDAVRAAGLTASLAAAVDGRETAAGTGYVTAAAPVDHPALRWFVVREVLPLRPTVVRAWLREHHDPAGPVTLKKSGVRLDPEGFRRDLRLPRRTRGGDEVVLVLTTVAGSARALVVERLGPPSPSAVEH
ncbi:class I SAM-dependent methyltransferase [uncultured Serinicoccus sp.]|uniref:class I SAM-dependent methyltransferase n=1 Tax=uncultured Serinicoccus sp. TaxID=735514 RepID=UPI0026146F42|nr:class I SAM-dependent methyltransferase [uncultured Serinicoccus sp.]